LVDSPGGTKILEEQAQALFETIKYIPSPGQARKLDEMLAQFRLGQGEVPGARALRHLSDGEAIRKIQEALKKTIERDTDLMSVADGREVADKLADKAKELFAMAKSGYSQEQLHKLDDLLGQVRLGQEGLPDARSLQGLPNADKASKIGEAIGQRMQQDGDLREMLDDPAIAARIADQARALAQETSATVPGAPPGTVVGGGSPDQGAKAAGRSPPPPINLELHFVCRYVGDSCDVAIHGPWAKEAPPQRVTRSTGKAMYQEMASIHHELLKLLPELYIKGFGKTGGETAQFDVSVRTEGVMTPIGAAACLASLAQGSFAEFKQRNGTANASFTIWRDPMLGEKSILEQIEKARNDPESSFQDCQPKAEDLNLLP
jgi:hypothetical protein